jgi:hypothetical protein
MPSLIGRCGGGGSTGAWALLTATGFVVPDNTTTFVAFSHFTTSDTSVFATSVYPAQTPGNAAGDTAFLLLKAGVYTAEFGFLWSTNFANQVYSNVTFQTFHGANWARPDAWHTNVSPGSPAIAGPDYGSSAVYPVTAADLPGAGQGTLNVVNVFQNTGGSKTISAFTLRLAYVPTGDTETAVY